MASLPACLYTVIIVIIVIVNIIMYINSATKLLHTRGETPILDANSGNPFAERPSTARQTMMQKHVIDSALSDLDKPVNMPDGVEDGAWERLCKYRRAKINSEMLVGADTLTKHVVCC